MLNEFWINCCRIFRFVLVTSSVIAYQFFWHPIPVSAHTDCLIWLLKSVTALAVVGCASYAFPIRSQAHFTAFAPGRFGPTGTAAALSLGVRALPCQRGGIIGRSNFRASSFSCGKINKCMFLIMFSSHTSYPQTYPHSFAVPRKIRHQIGEKMLSR